MPAPQRINRLRDPRDLRLARIAGPCALVIFGITGDLSRKKLLPALYDLKARDLLPPGFSVVGVARAEGDGDFLAVAKQAVMDHARTPFDESVWLELASGLRLITGDFADQSTFVALRDTLDEVARTRATNHNVAFYLSIPPKVFPLVCEQLAACGLADQSQGWRRVVIEKPFGHDAQSAEELHQVVSSVFGDEDVFRIDHYLGKETVQNILALRFANELFEPLWNARHVDHVQITMAEDIGIGGRAGYYDGIGAARDVIQNHLLQLLALTAMEEPVSFEAAELRTEKNKILSAVHLDGPVELCSAPGQYTAGWQGSEYVPGYLQEAGIPAASRTETYAALALTIDTRRWAGVPFYVRAGKRLGRRVTEIAIMFKPAPHLPFGHMATNALSQNALVLRIQPDEGTTLRFGSKAPGNRLDVRDVTMDFLYGHRFTESSPEAYERLILDVLLGEAPLFPQQREVMMSWHILDPVLNAWERTMKPEPYQAGTWGPQNSDAMLARRGHVWRRP